MKYKYEHLIEPLACFTIKIEAMEAEGWEYVSHAVYDKMASLVFRKPAEQADTPQQSTVEHDTDGTDYYTFTANIMDVEGEREFYSYLRECELKIIELKKYPHPNFNDTRIYAAKCVPNNNDNLTNSNH